MSFFERPERSAGLLLFWVAAASVIIAATTPKLLFAESVPLYLGELLIPFGPVLVALIWPAAFRSIKVTRVEALIVVYYAFVALGAAFTGAVWGMTSTSGLLLLAKRLIYHLIVFLLVANGLRLLGALGERELNRFLSSILYLGLIPLTFSFVELAVFASAGLAVPMINLAGLSDSYGPSLFVVGFTGRALGPDGLYLVGSSSINYGILNSALATIAIVRFEATRQRVWLVLSFVYACGVLLSFSSTALLVLVLSLLVGFVLQRNAPLRLFLVAVAMVLLAVGAAFVPLERAKLFAIGDAVETFQAVLFGGEHSYNVDARVETFDKALSTFAATPYVAFTGVGLGEFSAKAMRTDDPLVESFMLDALLNAGFIGFLALALSFLLLARYVSVVRRNSEGPSRIIAESLVRLAPGLVIANTLSGNSVQSEFVGGLLFLMLAACAWKASYANSARAEGRT